jgi:hypothetical protein
VPNLLAADLMEDDEPDDGEAYIEVFADKNEERRPDDREVDLI